MKKLLSVVAAITVSAAIAYAAYIPNLTGPQDPSQMLATINTLIGNIKAGTNGLVGIVNVAAASTGTTAEQTLGSISVPANTLTQSGQSLRIACHGTTAANTNNKTVKLYYGTASMTTPVMSTSGQIWELSMLVTYGASSTQSIYGGRGSTSFASTLGLVAPVSGVDTTDAFTSAATVKCTTTQGTASASDTTLNELIVEQVK